jgi:hypothetical protein
LEPVARDVLLAAQLLAPKRGDVARCASFSSGWKAMQLNVLERNFHSHFQLFLQKQLEPICFFKNCTRVLFHHSFSTFAGIF